MQYKIFWCKLNKFYLNKRLNYFNQTFSDNSDKFLLTTCVVTDRAKTKRLKEVKQIIKSWKKIYITGCGTLEKWKLIYKSKFYNIYPELKEFKNQIYLLPEQPKINSSKIKLTKLIPSEKNIYTRKFIVIQNGCDNFCSFCLTVKKRGNHRNRPAKEIINEINDFQNSWWKEIILTWVNLAARWCKDTKKPSQSKFPKLLKAILTQTKIPRIRISSLWPEYLSDEFFKIISSKRFLPHFHISIQSFSDNILKSMNRNYNYQDLSSVISKFKKLKRSDKNQISIWADIIIWFPGETEGDFTETLENVKKFQITKIHSFPFSKHSKWETVPASKFKNQVDDKTKKERQKILLNLTDKIREKFILRNKNLHHNVLIEWFKDGKWHWRTWNYIQANLNWDFKRWEIVSVEKL
jgi:MiaB/RimO family radical SAM methylthiotransferase